MLQSGLFVGKSFSFTCDDKGMSESALPLTPLQSKEVRHHDRTHMFVAATLYSDIGSCPVHIRNMSLQGALIEGSALPELDAPVTLRRGDLAASARIVWLAGRKAGVAFCATVYIADWMSRNGDSHQARVDDIVRDIRSERGRPDPAPGSPNTTPVNTLLNAELTALRAELIAMESGLTGDIVVVATHPEIQLLDVALQRVERMLRSTSCS